MVGLRVAVHCYLLHSLLVKHLTYPALPSTDAMQYECVKQAILDRYEVSDQFYRLKFRNSVRKFTENGLEWVNNLTHHFIGWLKFTRVDTHYLQAIVELMIMDPWIRLFIGCPKTLVDISQRQGPNILSATDSSS